MYRTSLTVAVATALLLTLAGTGRAGQRVTLNAAFNNGATKVSLTFDSASFQGSGAMVSGTARYPMSVTGGQVSGNYVTLAGVVQGSHAKASYKLYLERATGNAYWVINNGSPIAGKGAVMTGR